MTTLEGLLLRTISGLSQDQVVRRVLHPEDAEKIDEYIERVEQLLTVAKPFELTVVDPSGNSWVENPHAPRADSGKVFLALFCLFFTHFSYPGGGVV